MTYDGYGRLKTRHVPEQDAGTATSWVYNTDHTIQSITDARGASTTFTYNNGRHLPNVVTHALAGSSTIVESFSYDAAGNRTSMSDSSGGTTYQYNQLSQMTSETRTFAGLGGSYALAYEYHVGGQLKSLTDHTNQRINYAYDSAGRFNALTGTNYTYGQFINNVSYRAWGGPRQISYGNGRTESVTYNARLKTNHYEIPAGGGFGAAVSIDYQYYDDGRLKYSHDLLDNRFDRSYEYDHVARLTKAFSGAEARGEPATNDRPYKETATYDAFNHLNVRSSKHWSKLLGFGSSDTYVNNRRVGWTYDAEGNWLSGAGRQKTYDAAGRPGNTSWTGGYFNEFLDGDGWRVKATEPNQVTYYLRSTVLGGQVVEELNSSGAKQQSFIYIGQKVVGHDWANGNVSLLHEDPAGVTVRSSIPQAAFVTYFAELDPWGAEVFSWDPYLDDPEFSGGRGESGPVYPGFGDIGMPSTGCMLDGVYALCDFISRGMNSGAMALQLTQGGKTKQFPIEPGLLGMYAVWVEDAGKKLNKPQTPVDAQISADDVIATNTDDDGLGHWELISFAPQNPVPLPGTDAIKSRLNTGNCNAYIASLIAKANELYGGNGNVAVAKDGLDLLSKISAQGGFVTKDFLKLEGWPIAGTVSGSIAAKTATVLISTRFMIGNSASTIAMWQTDYINTAIHEMLHLSGKYGGYDDTQLATAASKLPGAAAGLPAPPKDHKDMKAIFANSGYFDTELKKHCGGK